MRASSVGSVPVQSPLVNEVILPWSMNFAAGINDMRPKYFDNTEKEVKSCKTIGPGPSKHLSFRDNTGPISTILSQECEVHPLFPSGCVEIIGFWASLYASGGKVI